MAMDSGRFIAEARSLERLNTEFAAAGSAGGRNEGVSNASPPASRATSDSVRTSTPFAPSEMSTPLAFQKRVPGLTYLSYGALTNTLSSTAFPSAARS